MVSRLAARLRAQPDDVEGWIVLARSYEYLQRYDDAVVAYQKAMALAPDQPQLLADYADALASARDGDLGGPAQAAIDAALAIDPDHPKSLALAGMAAFKRGDLAQARQHWEKVLALLPPDSEAARKIAADLAQLDSDESRALRRAPKPMPKQCQRHGLDRCCVARPGIAAGHRVRAGQGGGNRPHAGRRAALAGQGPAGAVRAGRQPGHVARIVRSRASMT